MNKERYMSVFKKSLGCNKEKKNLICEELDADIQEAMKNGESWSDIQERLGEPHVLANEFNENLGVKNSSPKKKVWIYIVLCRSYQLTLDINLCGRRITMFGLRQRCIPN